MTIFKEALFLSSKEMIYHELANEGKMLLQNELEFNEMWCAFFMLGGGEEGAYSV